MGFHFSPDAAANSNARSFSSAVKPMPRSTPARLPIAGEMGGVGGVGTGARAPTAERSAGSADGSGGGGGAGGASGGGTDGGVGAPRVAVRPNLGRAVPPIGIMSTKGMGAIEGAIEGNEAGGKGPGVANSPFNESPSAAPPGAGSLVCSVIRHVTRSARAF